MNSSVEVDSLEILVIVDNVVDPLSTNPPWVEPEIRGLLNRGRIRMLSGSSICCGHHGLSLLLKAQIGDVTQTLLFDTGAERQNFERNSKILDVDFSAITDIVLSHGHWVKSCRAGKTYRGACSSSRDQILGFQRFAQLLLPCHQHGPNVREKGQCL